MGPAAAVPIAMGDYASQLLHWPPLMIKVGGVATLVNETLGLSKGRVIEPLLRPCIEKLCVNRGLTPSASYSSP